MTGGPGEAGEGAGHGAPDADGPADAEGPARRDGHDAVGPHASAPSPADPVSDDPFERPARSPLREDMLHVALEAYEGPLDLLLDLARREKIDLTRIAVLPLAEQYLAFVERAQRLKIELAADMLVMAAWLTYLKSRLLAPQAEEDEEGEELAEDLAFRLRRLEAMREAADAFAARPRLGVTLMARGMPEVPPAVDQRQVTGSLHDLVKAYASVRQSEIVRTTTMEKRRVFSLVDARRVVERVVGGQRGWTPLSVILAAMPTGEARRSVLASTFGATLEMAREGTLTVRQDRPFAPLMLRGRV